MNQSQRAQRTQRDCFLWNHCELVLRSSLPLARQFGKLGNVKAFSLFEFFALSAVKGSTDSRARAMAEGLDVFRPGELANLKFVGTKIDEQAVVDPR